jgi:hypothetical protein
MLGGVSRVGRHNDGGIGKATAGKYLQKLEDFDRLL